MERPRRPAIKTYSTKCRPPWRVEPKPSLIYRTLACSISGISLIAWFSAPLHFWVALGCATVALLMAFVRLKATRGLIRVTHDPTEDLWSLQLPNKQTIKGSLICAGYRSAYLVILVIQQENTQHHYCPIWQDQIDASDFSYLHHQLLFNTSTPVKRKLTSFLPYVKTS